MLKVIYTCFFFFFRLPWLGEAGSGFVDSVMTSYNIEIVMTKVYFVVHALKTIDVLNSSLSTILLTPPLVKLGCELCVALPVETRAKKKIDAVYVNISLVAYL